ncbi:MULTISPECIES: metallophosphoesterase [unclassified Rhodococcus (in: high G+C Gram-positive bacteria)]|uniref:metallophosphoesterase n=1 Tax=unclassified Rhodococcus (in: high G+C Gram-positive bacteria) TaxID=192944 RepID=UPI000928E620|nr:metallophosphoesterase [Rhodococcus sp. M8]OLL17923.1 metallophosphoesterase [Rhodococcus sp. M8]QPG46202.1 metallophosphoesterase [Rhodococcus sp. M8]
MIRLLVAGTFLALVTFWLHRRLVRAPGLRGRSAIAANTALGVLLVVALIGAQSGTSLDPRWARLFGFLGWTWLGVVLYLVLGTLLIGIVCLAARAVRRFRRGDAHPPDPSRRRALQIATGTLTVAAVAAVGYGTVEAARPRVVHTRIPLRRLPAGFDGMRVALVTDLHVGPSRGRQFTRRAVDLVNAQQPDLIVLGGDLTDGTIAFVGQDLAPLADLRAPLGVYGVSGNHEYYADDALSWLDFWETLGVRTLRNERVALERGGDVIDLAGIHDYSAPAPNEADLTAALQGRDPERFVLLAAHQPRQVFEARDHGVDLQLSGHTHGGQMWPLGYVVPLQQPTVTGLDRFGDTLVYTSRGTGAWGPPVRIATPPEVAILELKTFPG